MASPVYVWPYCLGASTDFGAPIRITRERRLGGGPAQDVEIMPRAPIRLQGAATRAVRPDLDLILERLLAGGLALVWDMERRRFGWDGRAAFSASGAEFWRADGQVGAYAGEAANPPTGPWRSVDAQAAGAASAGARTIAVDGLLGGETIPKGCPVRIGDYRYTMLAAATADGAGAATLSIGTALRAAVADNATVTIPGDTAVCRLIEYTVAPTSVDGVTEFDFALREVYSTEVSGGFSYIVD